MFGEKGESYLYLIIIVIVGAFLFGGGSRLLGNWSTTKFSGPEPTPTPAAATPITPTTGAIQLPGAPTATPTLTPTP